MAPKKNAPKWWKGTQSLKKKAAVGKEDLLKLKKTIRWWNKHGGLLQPLKIDTLMGPLKRMGKWSAFATLKGLEKKATELENPTAWVLGSAKKAGAIKSMNWATEQKLRKTVAWLNSNGGLQLPLSLCIVTTALAKLKPKIAMGILSQLGEKAPTLRDPNSWVCAKAKMAEKEYTIKKMAYWLNNKGGLSTQLHTDAIVWPLSSIELWQAKQVLNDLSKKKAEVNNPTAWVNGWAHKIYASNNKRKSGKPPNPTGPPPAKKKR